VDPRFGICTTPIRPFMAALRQNASNVRKKGSRSCFMTISTMQILRHRARRGLFGATALSLASLGSERCKVFGVVGKTDGEKLELSSKIIAHYRANQCARMSLTFWLVKEYRSQKYPTLKNLHFVAAFCLTRPMEWCDRNPSSSSGRNANNY
jgi:hypothetical protein